MKPNLGRPAEVLYPHFIDFGSSADVDGNLPTPMAQGRLSSRTPTLPDPARRTPVIIELYWVHERKKEEESHNNYSTCYT